MSVTREEIDSAYKLLADMALDRRNRLNDEVSPAVVVFGPRNAEGLRGPVTLMPDAFVVECFSSAEGKTLLGHLMRKMLDPTTVEHVKFGEMHGWTPRLIGVLSEAWVVSASDSDIDCMPSEHPDRKEIVMVAINTADASYMGRMPIAGGKLTFEPIDWSNNYTMTGKLATHVDLPVRH